MFELELKKIKVKINKSAWQLKQLKKKNIHIQGFSELMLWSLRKLMDDLAR